MQSPLVDESGRLTFEAAIEILGTQLADLPIVLVGGQALNYWVDRYRARVPELAAEWPFTSEDIDFSGTRAAVDELSERLGVIATKPGLDDATPNSGVLTLPIASGGSVRIDVLWTVLGIKDRELRETALTATNRAETLKFKVMHPVLCMFSRTHNVIGLPGQYDNPHGLKQLRGSIFCAREFMRELIANGQPENARGLTERIFRFALRNPARKAYLEKGIDVFSAIEQRTEYGEMFCSRRYPQMGQELARRRVPDPRRE